MYFDDVTNGLLSHLARCIGYTSLQSRDHVPVSSQNKVSSERQMGYICLYWAYRGAFYRPMVGFFSDAFS